MTKFWQKSNRGLRRSPGRQLVSQQMQRTTETRITTNDVALLGRYVRTSTISKCWLATEAASRACENTLPILKTFCSHATGNQNARRLICINGIVMAILQTSTEFIEETLIESLTWLSTPLVQYFTKTVLSAPLVAAQQQPQPRMTRRKAVWGTGLLFCSLFLMH